MSGKGEVPRMFKKEHVRHAGHGRKSSCAILFEMSMRGRIRAVIHFLPVIGGDTRDLSRGRRAKQW